MSKRIKNAPGTVKLGAGKVGTRAKAMRKGAGGPDLRLGMGLWAGVLPTPLFKNAPPKSKEKASLSSFSAKNSAHTHTFAKL